DAQEEIMVQDYQETAAVEKHVNQNNNVSENENENVEETDPELDPSSLYQGNNNVDSEGNSTYGGNQGKPDGGESDNYNGGPNGDGISYSMSGRSPVGKFPKPDYPPGNVYGKVVINIKVDKYGKVISVNVGKGTTATDDGLITAAKKAAWKVRFNEDYNSIEQTGTITYNFSLQ
ncbi:MAG: energy transducer TonB, partial [Bacteroidota bacterium]